MKTVPESVTISQASILKNQLEADLESIICKFQKESGCTVRDILFHRTSIRDYDGKECVSTFAIETVVSI